MATAGQSPWPKWSQRSFSCKHYERIIYDGLSLGKYSNDDPMAESSWISATHRVTQVKKRMDFQDGYGDWSNRHVWLKRGVIYLPWSCDVETKTINMLKRIGSNGRWRGFCTWSGLVLSRGLFAFDFLFSCYRVISVHMIDIDGRINASRKET